MASAVGKADLTRCIGVFDLFALLASRSITRFFEESSGAYVDMLSIYRWAAANNVCHVPDMFASLFYESPLVNTWLTLQAARHTELLQAFSNRQSGSDTEDVSTEGAEELTLILEVVDILDELNILILLFEKQVSVVADIKLYLVRFQPVYPVEHLEDLVKEAEQLLQFVKTNTERLHGEVTQTHKLVSHPRSKSLRLRESDSRHSLQLLELLDLEQKAASLGEARVATKQGQAVMLFTIITIIFVCQIPSSFLDTQLILTAPPILLHFLLWSKCCGVYW